jgi:hypothetical protein
MRWFLGVGSLRQHDRELAKRSATNYPPRGIQSPFSGRAEIANKPRGLGLVLSSEP